MLVPQHPRPVGRRRAVAEMTVAARQAAAIEPGHVLHIADAHPGADLPVTRREGPGVGDDVQKVAFERLLVSRFPQVPPF